MSYREFVTWQAFNAISPIGDERNADIGPALTRQLMVELKSRKGARRTRLEEFLPFRPRRAAPENDLDAALIEWARSNGAVDS